jgi:ABC-type polysaccharide/polyol phosphate transport system, ATPase component
MSSRDLLSMQDVSLMDSRESDIAIKFDHVTKTYKLYESDQQRFASIFWGKKKREAIMAVNANDDLSFEIKKGEAVAFLGENGAGKSTALKMVTGVAYPTKGVVTVNGHVSALLELTAGFDKSLTGRENIHLRGQALGFSSQQLAELEPKTVEFADLGVYIDQPVRMYSSGMKSRLGFGFAVSSNPEILVVDEALAVGDKRFREKCYARVREIMEDENVTVLFVTHSSGAAEEFCRRGIVLEHGKKVFDGPIQEAIDFYGESN